MSVEYEWNFDADSPAQEQTPGGGRRRARWRTILIVAAAVILVAATGSYLVWRLRRTSVSEAAADVLGTVQLEQRALEAGDSELYVGLQDGEDGAWIESQRRNLSAGSPLPPPAPGFVATKVLTVETPTVFGDRAEVHFLRLAGPPGGLHYPFRAVSFYRLLPDGRWVHAAPDPEYAGRPLAWVGPRNDLVGHIVQTDLFEQLAAELELTAEAFCELFACPPDLRFALALTGTLLAETPGAGVLPSPHLTGVPVGEAATAAWTQAIENYLIDLMIARAAGDPSGGFIVAALRAQIKEYLGVGQQIQADPALLAEALDAGRLPTLANLWAGTVPDEAREIAEDAATVLVRFVEQEYGREGVVALLSAAARAPEPNALFAIAFGADAGAVEQRWLEYLAREVIPEAALLSGTA